MSFDLDLLTIPLVQLAVSQCFFGATIAVYKVLYNWPNETMEKQATSLALRTKEVQLSKNDSKQRF